MTFYARKMGVYFAVRTMTPFLFFAIVGDDSYRPWPIESNPLGWSHYNEKKINRGIEVRPINHIQKIFSSSLKHCNIIAFYAYE